MSLKDKLLKDISLIPKSVDLVKHEEAKNRFVGQGLKEVLGSPEGIQGRHVDQFGAITILNAWYNSLVEDEVEGKALISFGSTPITLLSEARTILNLLSNTILNPGKDDVQFVFQQTAELLMRVDEVLGEYKRKLEEVTADMTSSQSGLPSRLEVLEWVMSQRPLSVVGQVRVQDQQVSLNVHYQGVHNSLIISYACTTWVQTADESIIAPTPPWMLVLLNAYKSKHDNTTWLLSTSEFSNQLREVLRVISNRRA